MQVVAVVDLIVLVWQEHPAQAAVERAELTVVMVRVGLLIRAAAAVPREVLVVQVSLSFNTRFNRLY
jgi:hypothetical protein